MVTSELVERAVRASHRAKDSAEAAMQEVFRKEPDEVLTAIVTLNKYNGDSGEYTYEDAVVDAAEKVLHERA